ncbi:MAG: hypothetical protein ACRCWF_17725 [Beijerinckiaceae bacterium]
MPQIKVMRWNNQCPVMFVKDHDLAPKDTIRCLDPVVAKVTINQGYGKVHVFKPPREDMIEIEVDDDWNPVPVVVQEAQPFMAPVEPMVSATPEVPALPPTPEPEAVPAPSGP